MNFGHLRIAIGRGQNIPAGIRQEQTNPALSAVAFPVWRRIFHHQNTRGCQPAAAARLRRRGDRDCSQRQTEP